MHRSGYWHAIFSAPRGAWGIALLEILVVAAISLLPLLIAVFLDVIPTTSNTALSEAVQKAFFGGQLIFYSIGLIATIVWNSNKEYNAFLPWRHFINLYCLFSLVTCTVLIVHDPRLVNSDPNILWWLSTFLFLSALVIYMVLGVIQQVKGDVGKSQKKDDLDLQQRVRKSRGLAP
jgi:Ca2+/Na+ antiporter